MHHRGGWNEQFRHFRHAAAPRRGYPRSQLESWRLSDYFCERSFRSSIHYEVASNGPRRRAPFQVTKWPLNCLHSFRCPFGEGEHPSYEELYRMKKPIPVPWCIKMQNIKNSAMPSWLVPYIFKFSKRTGVKLCSLTKQIIDENAHNQVEKNQ